jgi:hypothetical protein
VLHIGLSNITPSHSIFGNTHPAPVNRLAQIVTPPGLRASNTMFTKTRSPFQNSFTPRLSVLRLIWPTHCHFSVLILCAPSLLYANTFAAYLYDCKTVVTYPRRNISLHVQHLNIIRAHSYICNTISESERAI